jgi:hypothetical protein
LDERVERVREGRVEDWPGILDAGFGELDQFWRFLAYEACWGNGET